MIAKGNLHAHGVKLAAYLTTSSADERAELVELKGFAATNIRDAFIDVQMQAAATRATKPFFHAYVRAPEGEQLSREQWQTFADRLETQLGFDGQPRAVAFHNQADGERHMHIAWSRIDLASLTAIDPGLYKNKMKELCRAFEQEHGLTKVANERGADVKTKSANRAEFEQSRRLGTDLKAIRNTIHDCWQSADSGSAFAAALAEHGFVLAKGDQRPFVIIDREGGDHALSKRITGATAAVTRQRMADIDRARLPSVAEGKAIQSARYGKLEPVKAAARERSESVRVPASRAETRGRPPVTQQPIRVIGSVARPAGGLLRTAGKALDGIAGAFESLLGGASKPKRGAEESAPLDHEAAAAKAETKESSQSEQEQKAARLQKYLRHHSRDVPDEAQRDADIERDKTTGRERTRGE